MNDQYNNIMTTTSFKIMTNSFIAIVYAADGRNTSDVVTYS